MGDDATGMVTDMETRQHCRFFFGNGYGVSIVRGPYTYGYEQGLWELAVLVGDERGHTLCYDTPITDDVVGYCSEERLLELMTAVANLPRRECEQRDSVSEPYDVFDADEEPSS